jgi:hypothetical protein
VVEFPRHPRQGRLRVRAAQRPRSGWFPPPAWDG